MSFGATTSLPARPCCTVPSLLIALKQCGKRGDLEQGKTLHLRAIQAGFHVNKYVASALITMYSKFGGLKHARAVFNNMNSADRDTVLWNTLILGFAENGESFLAMDLFSCIDCQPEQATFVAAIKSCASLIDKADKLFCLETGIRIHKQAKELGLSNDLQLAATLVDMYSKCGCMRHAQQVFEGVRARAQPDVVLWTSLILGHAENGESLKALDLFTRMDCPPNSVTFVAVLRACRSLAALAVGKQIHAHIRKLGLEQDPMVATALVDFYGKCGAMPAAEEVFERMQRRDVVSWTALVAGYSSLGEFSRVFALVKRMQEGGVWLDQVMFLEILTACSHAGLVEEGKECFEMMCGYGVTPALTHYACLIDMLGRANRLHEALTVLGQMPFPANTVVWTSLLRACRKWNNVEVGSVAIAALRNCL